MSHTALSPSSPIIATTADLTALCQRLSTAPYVTVDTEFMREKTYYAQLCLVQVAGPDEAWAIDPLAPDMDLRPLFDLLTNPQVLKVFHSARQDIEIFVQLTGTVPAPLFDTQIAAMVCGFGEQVGYEALVAGLTKARIDKTMRFTDWSLRPLATRQVQYALADVTHLRDVYTALHAKLEATGRAAWLVEEMAQLSALETYRPDPMEAWRRLKPRSSNARFLATLQLLAAWREGEAQNRNLPRQRFLKDEALLEIAASAPSTLDELGRLRSMSKGMVDGWMGTALLEVLEQGRTVPLDNAPKLADRPHLPRGTGPLLDLLRVLLKIKCDENDVAQRLVADNGDLEALALNDDADIQALQGWRYDLFGKDALRLKRGQLALGFCTQTRSPRLVDMSEDPTS